MIGVLDAQTGNLTALAVHHPAGVGNVRYQPGEGIL
jgi:hypothetical protein